MISASRYRDSVLATVILSLNLLAQSVRGEDKFAFGPQVDVKHLLLSGNATISAAKEVFRLGERIELEFRFDATSPGTVYNPYFDSLTVQPAVLALFDSNKRYLGDLLARHHGSFRGPSASNWVNVGTGGFVGTSLVVCAGDDPGDLDSESTLPPGKYYLQLIFNRYFVSPPPQDPVAFARKGPGNWVYEYHQQDIFRSNCLILEFK